MFRMGRRATAAVVFMLLVGPAVPAAAAVSEACPSSIVSAGFGDVSGLDRNAIDAVNCIAHYGITRGTSTRTFSPYDTVPRWQMAIFLVRTAEDLGMTLPVGSSVGFTDLGGLDATAQTAVNQLFRLGVTKGTSATTFSPYDAVPRWQMAIFLVRLAQGAGVALPSGAPVGFTDLGGLDATAQTAVNQLFRLGVTKGTSATTYSPYTVTVRWQMALFIVAELEVGKARPYTVTITPAVATAQTSDTVTLTVTVKKADGTAAADRRVDVFVGSPDASGRCVLDADARLGTDAGTGTNCTIDSGDPRTNASGVATIALTHAAVAEVDTVRAWLGEPGEVFDAHLVRTSATATVTWVSGVAALVVDDVVARYGTSETGRARLVDSGGGTVALAGQRVVFRVSRSGAQILSGVGISDVNGIASYSYVGPADPSPGDDSGPTDTVVAFWDKDGDGVDDGPGELDDSGAILWDDEQPRVDTAVLSQGASTRAVGQVHTVTATVRDKFGGGVSGATVTWTVSGANPAAGTATTNASGVATFSYLPSSGGVDTVDASVSGPVAIAVGSVANLTVYAVTAAPDLAGSTTFDILAADTAANTIDVLRLSDGSPFRLAYDGTADTFTVGASATSMAGFEAALASLGLPDPDGPGGTSLTTNPYSAAPAAASTFVLLP